MISEKAGDQSIGFLSAMMKTMVYKPQKKSSPESPPPPPIKETTPQPPQPLVEGTLKPPISMEPHPSPASTVAVGITTPANNRQSLFTWLAVIAILLGIIGAILLIIIGIVLWYFQILIF